jgi:preprotein translocase SecF subunit
MREQRERRPVLDFVSKRYFYFAISLVVIIAGVVSLAIPPGLKVGIDFKSGSILDAQFPRDVDQSALRDKLAALGHPDAKIQRTGEGRFLIQTRPLEGGEVDSQFEGDLNAKLKELFPAGEVGIEPVDETTFRLRLTRNVSTEGLQDALLGLAPGTSAVQRQDDGSLLVTFSQAVAVEELRREVEEFLQRGFTLERTTSDILLITFSRDLSQQGLEQTLQGVAPDQFSIARQGHLQYQVTMKQDIPEAELRRALSEFVQDDYELQRTAETVYRVDFNRLLSPGELLEPLRSIFPEEQVGIESTGENAYRLTLPRAVPEEQLRTNLLGLTEDAPSVVEEADTVFLVTFSGAVAEADLLARVQDLLRTSNFTLAQETPGRSITIIFLTRSIGESQVLDVLRSLPPEQFVLEQLNENAYRLSFQREVAEESLRGALQKLSQQEVAVARSQDQPFTYTVTLAGEVAQDAVESAVADLLKDDFTLEQLGVTRYQVALQRDLTEEALNKVLGELPDLGYAFRRATDNSFELIFPGEKTEILSSLSEDFGQIQAFEFNTVSPLVAQRTTRIASTAVGVASLAILLYITWAFRRMPRPLRWGFAALIALAHDVMITIGMFSIFGKTLDAEINLMFITGILTVVGFSVHDTIVVFDRIRENMNKFVSPRFESVVNISIVETMGRSLTTSLTLLFTVVALLLFGGSTLRDFMLVLLVGVAVGTYSSIFVAAQVLVAWEKGELAVPVRFALAPFKWLWSHRPLRRQRGAAAKAS